MTNNLQDRLNNRATSLHRGAQESYRRDVRQRYCVRLFSFNTS